MIGITRYSICLAALSASTAASAAVEINLGPDWRTTSAVPGAGWNTDPGYDDSAWGSPVVSNVVAGVSYYWAPSGTTAYFRYEFELTGSVLSGLLSGGVDDDVSVWINGTQVVNDQNGIANNYSADIGAYLHGGWNLVAVQTRDSGGGRGVSAKLSIENGAVPEPATWAMLITGFALAGAALRKRPSARVAFA